MLTLNLEQLNTVQLDNNTIPSDAFYDAYHRLEDMGAPLIARRLNALFEWNTDCEWRRWKTTAGRWTTRFSKYLHKDGIDIEKPVLEVLGETIRRHVPNKTEVHLEISKFGDWKHGSFEPAKYSPDGRPPGACWWNDYASVRLGLMQDEGGHSILIYDSPEQFENHQHTRGEGRCWMYQPDPDHAIIFNAYGPLRLGQIAEALSVLWGGLPYKKIRLRSDEGRAGYINAGEFNNEGRKGGREGVGYVIGLRAEYYDPYILPTFRYKDGECFLCKTQLCKSENHSVIYKDERVYICGHCRITHSPCLVCGMFYEKDELLSSDMGKRSICAECAKNKPRCTHGPIVNPYAKVWHTDRVVCRACLYEGLVVHCEGCNHLLDTEHIHTIRLAKLNLRLCVACLRKVREYHD